MSTLVTYTFSLPTVRVDRHQKCGNLNLFLFCPDSGRFRNHFKSIDTNWQSPGAYAETILRKSDIVLRLAAADFSFVSLAGLVMNHLGHWTSPFVDYSPPPPVPLFFCRFTCHQLYGVTRSPTIASRTVFLLMTSVCKYVPSISYVFFWYVTAIVWLRACTKKLRVGRKVPNGVSL